MKIIKTFFVIFIIFYVNSCDILRSSPFEVVSWSPGGGCHSEPERIIVSAEFSGDPDKTSVERHFSLSAESGKVKGKFEWNGRKMIFIPLSPLEKYTDYTLNISADAHDTEGLSMDTAFDVRFSTRPGTERPSLLSYYPENYAEVEDERMEVKLRFSLPVTLNTLNENVSFSPSMTGNWRLEEDDFLAIFTPFEPWKQNNRYEIRITTTLADYKNKTIGKDFLSIFTIGTDHELPYLLNVYRITKNEEIEMLEADENNYTGAPRPLVENEGWEKDDKILLEFSKPVDGITVKNYLSVEGASSFVLETPIGFETKFIFNFETIPVFGSRFVIKIKPGIKDKAANESKNEYIYRIFANGKKSKPPELVGIRLPMAPKREEEKDLVAFGIDTLFEYLPISDIDYPSREGVETWIEFYFDTAQGASVDPFSLIELFRIETSNNVLTFSPRRLKTNNFLSAEPQQGWEEYSRIELIGVLTNSVNFGIVNFQIASGLKDNLGNKSEKIFRISTLK